MNQIKHFYTTCIKIEYEIIESLDIENRKAHSITRQLRHRLRTVNRRGNRQQPRNCCG